ncbi:hypothetical protein [Rufibacter radiotolerans]|uniref:Uncharacterized protein n=1 Tax=Rufibacter radiotolerans TaxID=1379910 RepID=A0A0H4VIE6_9BACT|nr:hypothetical protein [Rufibacter radiotolerans]AKQ45143.1 hypothetical protein TH63_05035 [Rufibacter radiotolerans]
MFANELRLGNIVSEAGTYVVIDAGRMMAILSGEAALYDPIPLTDEWLSGANYDELEDEFMFPELSQWALDPKYKEIVFNGGYIATSAPVAYVHQLQNFFFVMTGQEMELPCHLQL